MGMDWLRDPGHRVLAAKIIFWSCWILWPLSSFTIFSQANAQEHGFLGLSWLAIIIEMAVLIVTTEIQKEDES